MKSKSLPNSDTYPLLLARVRETLVDGQRRIDAERVRTYWETGRIILTYILKNAYRAEYGAQVIKRLAKDLNIDLSNLRRCVQFVKIYPEMPIVGGRRQFTWTHFRKLIAISNDKKRARLEKAIIQKGWTADELSVRIHGEKSAIEEEIPDKSDESPPASHKLLTPLRGTPYTYRIIKRPNVASADEPEFYLDLGFGNFQEITPTDQSRFSDKTIVESRPAEDKFKLFESKRTAQELYTYYAVVERIIDGDTLKVRFQLGFGQWHREILRLRGLDCPELNTPKGTAAKTFVQSYIKEAQTLIVRSSRFDKYDRYLADVFISRGSEPDEETDIYLNNLLLQNNHAKRMD